MNLGLIEMNGTLKPFEGTGTIKSQLNLSTHFLMTAAQAVRRIQILEQENIGQENWDRILQDCLTSTILSVTSLEAYANELYAEGSILFNEEEKRCVDLHAEQIEKLPVLEKFNHALKVKGISPLTKGSSPTQETICLIKLRNALVHFKPEWMDSNAEHVKLSKKLRCYLNANELFNDAPLFPLAWASSGTAKWTVSTAASYIDRFHCQMALVSPSPLERSRIELNELLSNV